MQGIKSIIRKFCLNIRVTTVQTLISLPSLLRAGGRVTRLISLSPLIGIRFLSDINRTTGYFPVASKNSLQPIWEGENQIIYRLKKTSLIQHPKIKRMLWPGNVFSTICDMNKPRIRKCLPKSRKEEEKKEKKIIKRTKQR